MRDAKETKRERQPHRRRAGDRQSDRTTENEIYTEKENGNATREEDGEENMRGRT